MKKIKNQLLLNILVFFISIIIVLLSLEIIFRIFYPYYKNYDLEMWRYTRDFKEPNYQEDYCYRQYPEVFGSYYGVEIITNSQGFRAKKDYGLKDNAKKRILILGDSLTLGWGVEYNSTYPFVLEDFLNKNNKTYEVINAGIGNYNTVCEAELLENLIYLKPDIIVLGFYINDLEQIRKVSRIEYYLLSNSYMLAYFSSKINNINIKLNNDYLTYYNNLYEDRNKIEKTTLAFEKIIKISKDNDASLIIMNIPEVHTLGKNEIDAKANKFITKIIENNPDVFYLDLTPSLINQNPQKLWVSKEDSHFNEYANKIIAQSLFMELEKRNN